MGWFDRFRTSRGFGVHSPFAYALITDALRPGSGYAYYASASLPDNDTRLVYRLAAHLAAGEVKGCPQAQFKGLGPTVLHVLLPGQPLPEYPTGSDISKPIRSRSEVKADDSPLRPESPLPEGQPASNTQQPFGPLDGRLHEGDAVQPLPEGICEGDAVLIFNPSADSIATMTAMLDRLGGGMSFHATTNPLSLLNPLNLLNILIAKVLRSAPHFRSALSLRSVAHPYALFCFLPRLPRQDFHLHT